MVKKLLPLLLLPLLFAGCSTITNLTPAQMPRKASGLYLVEAKWDTREQALREGTLEPKVMIGDQFIPMQQTRNMANRWEALIAIPADKSSIHYRYKFDYEVNAIPSPEKSSKLSAEYQLKLVD